ncbi:MAG: tyrosine-type recombinase/integrase [Geobacter sp.]
MKFTDKYISSLKPKEKDYRVREGHGFAIRVLPSGVKRFEFIYTVSGKRRIMHLGNYPAVALTEARTKFNEAAALLARGTDPQHQAPPETTAVPPDQLTVTDLYELWVKWSEQHHSAKWANTLKLALGKDILPTYGQRLASDIRRRDAVAILEQKAATAPGQAVNLHKALRGMFQYAVERELVEYNPFSEIRAIRTIPNMKQTARERVLSDDEIKYLWAAIDQGGGSDSTQRALKMMLLTGQRNGEVCGMHRREIQIGTGKPRCLECERCGWWTIPKERRQGNKGGEHRIYLSPQAMQLIGDRKGFIFPGDTDNSSISANSVNHHVRRSVPATGKTPYYGLPRWTPHDLRRTCGTGIRRCGGSRDDMDLILGHVAGGVTGVYDRHTGEAEKERWLTAWGECTSTLVFGD